ncbi:MAG: ECF-type sigma factor [Steroidobacter sp.]
MSQNQYAELVRAADAGDQGARERLFAILYKELHLMAEREMRRHSGATLSPTTLLHETFINISGREQAQLDHKSFMPYAARAMRGLVIDYFRGRKALKRGGQLQIISLTDQPDSHADDVTDFEQLRDALESLSAIDPRLAECVDLKFFCGLSFRDIAELWNVSERTVQRDWEKARLLLNRLMRNVSLIPDADNP